MDFLTDTQMWISLLALTGLEIVLGIDNVIFISILSGKLPAGQQARARRLGLSLALITRILLLCSLAWMMKLNTPLFSLLGHGVSGRDLILLLGGLFLIAKSTHEIHGKLEGEDGTSTKRLAPSFSAVIVQILLLDVVFSLDSVITAVGMASQLGVMIAAVIIAVIIMLAFSEVISGFVDRHPTIKMLALSFLLLIGVTLVADGLGQHVPKGYIYFSMAFSLAVEMLNLRMHSKRKPIELHQPYR